MGIHFPKITGSIKKMVNPQARKTNRKQLEDIAQGMKDQSTKFKEAERADTFQKIDKLLDRQRAHRLAREQG